MVRRYIQFFTTISIFFGVTLLEAKADICSRESQSELFYTYLNSCKQFAEPEAIINCLCENASYVFHRTLDVCYPRIDKEIGADYAILAARERYRLFCGITEPINSHDIYHRRNPSTATTVQEETIEDFGEGVSQRRDLNS